MKKLGLDKLKVQSFVTSLENDENKTIKGGVWEKSDQAGCDASDPCLYSVDPGCSGESWNCQSNNCETNGWCPDTAGDVGCPTYKPLACPPLE